MQFAIVVKDILMNMIFNLVRIVLEENQLQKSNFQVFMKTKDNKVEPFTATYQTIDSDRGISAFTLQNVSPQIERQEKCINKRCCINRFKHKKMNEKNFS